MGISLILTIFHPLVAGLISALDVLAETNHSSFLATWLYCYRGPNIGTPFNGSVYSSGNAGRRGFAN